MAGVVQGRPTLATAEGVGGAVCEQWSARTGRAPRGSPPPTNGHRLLFVVVVPQGVRRVPLKFFLTEILISPQI